MRSQTHKEQVTIAALLDLIRLMGAELVLGGPAELRRFEAAVRRKLGRIDLSAYPPDVAQAGIAEARALVDRTLATLRRQTLQRCEANRRSLPRRVVH
ncbi:hypothetical protein PQJ75_29690 [Rhodoplanes sp. TEM]|uniref:Uncharacterized protein n=1 Tax=Rhodoplanes tepidamans TaxID=200616 RepID=A0ABT5JIU6_RHOTP|nr:MULTISPECIES: hypothetical protein [Rhodoplanes]MDC7789521.1 hypothetical protein [Rhodoplanes tepidamans]MDC7987927.1 hypothetical protein [Rhodoplanes sp. TEM]MDQ0359102.1 hypothetical protein [Rhodoplanes tepidamans]